jgi:capsular exopolysaccharide synthesis family protein
VISLSIEKNAGDAKRSAQEQIIKQLDQDLSKLPSLELQYAQLTRETEALVQVLKLLKSRFEEAKIKKDSQESDLKILESAQLPTAGISSMRLSKVILGIFMGIFLGVLLAFVLEFLDQSIKDPQNVEKALEIPLLGIVPMIEMEQALIESAPEKWKSVLEPFRALRATLKHLAATRQIKTFIICSAVKGEGKTTLAANLSITFALDGKKVILVDGDLRRAQMHSLFNLPKKTGLSDYLLGACDVNEIIKKTVHENLFVITAGEHPENPSELIGSARFDQLVSELRGMADYIIYDSPALLPVSDGLSMAPKIEVCIMVVRALWTPLKAAQQAKSQLNRMGCTIIGAILNGISHSRGYYPYYYGYYRYYAYKYSYEEDHEQGHKKFSMREFGLSVESKLRGLLQNFVFSIPHYTAILLNFTKHLMRKKTFWILLIVFFSIPLSALALKSAGFGIPNRKIAYLGKMEAILPAGRREAGASLEAIAQGQRAPVSDSASATFFASADSGRKGSAVDTTNILDGLSDSLHVWESAFNKKDIPRYLSFYDTALFKYPGGRYSAWKSEKTGVFDQSSDAQTMTIDSVWAEPMTPPFFQTSFTATLVSAHTTVRHHYAIIWRQSNNQWRIVREKSGE